VVEPVADPVVQAVADPVVQAVAEPVVQAVAEPVVQAVAQPEVQSVVQPVVQPVAQPVVEAVTQPVTAVPQGPPSRAHYLQLGAFSARLNAEAASAQLRRQLDWLQVPIEVEPHGSLFRVQAGPYPVRKSAARARMEVEGRTGLRPLLRSPD
jgi:cell division protein FtsN